MADRFDKFTDGARRALTLAQEEAQRLRHHYIGTEHLLLGLVCEGDDVAAQVLANLGVDLNRVRRAVEIIIGRGDRRAMGEVGLTPRAKQVIELAIDEARRLSHSYIGTQHLLLGLVREGEGIAAGVLESLGVNLERVRVETIRVLLGQSPPSETTGAGPDPSQFRAGQFGSADSRSPLDDSDLIVPRRQHRDTPIEDLYLSVRAYNCLKRNELMTVGQILAKSEYDLISLRNFGRKSYHELIDKLIEIGVLRRRDWETE